MKELDSARQRIQEKDIQFEAAKEVMRQKEQEFIDNLPKRFLNVFKELSDVSESQNGSPAIIEYYFQLSTELLEDSRPYGYIEHEILGVNTEAQTEKWKFFKQIVDRQERDFTDSSKYWTYYKLKEENRRGELYQRIIRRPKEALENKMTVKALWVSVIPGSKKSESEDGREKTIMIRFKVSKHGYLSVNCALKQGEYLEDIEIGKVGEIRETNTQIDLFMEQLENVVESMDSREVISDQLLKGKKLESVTEDDLMATNIDDLSGPRTDLIGEINEERLRREQEDERDRVLFLMEGLESSDSNYQRPNWISPHEKSKRGQSGLYPTKSEYEEYLTREDLDDAIQRHFPRPH